MAAAPAWWSQSWKSSKILEIFRGFPQADDPRIITLIDEISMMITISDVVDDEDEDDVDGDGDDEDEDEDDDEDEDEDEDDSALRLRAR